MKLNSFQNLLIDKLKLLSCALVANALIAKKSCHYGAVYEDLSAYFFIIQQKLSYTKK